MRSKTVKIILVDEFFDSDEEFANHLRMELDAGRPVMYMAQQLDTNAGHAFVIDGYSEDLFHVNWGWGGYANGYYDLSMTDLSGRSWSRNPLIYQYLEPTQDYSLTITDTTKRYPHYSWNGNGSLISLSSGTRTGYGLTIDEATIHPATINNPIVFFQWEIDNRDGTRLKIDTDALETATITYGPWNDRSKDVSYKNVTLPFVLDPQNDGFSVHDQEYYVIAVHFDEKPSSMASVIAEITTEQATTASSVRADKMIVDGATWNGNGSLISYSSGEYTGYGLEKDEGLISPTSKLNPVVFFQWERDSRDGTKLELSAPNMKADITYGLWNDRTSDITHQNVSFPFTLDPQRDGLRSADGEYYVIKVAFLDKPSTDIPVEAKTVK